MIQHKICNDTIRVLTHVRSQQNAQWIWSSPLTEVTIMGCKMILPPSLPSINRAVALLLATLAFKSHQRPL